MDTLISDGGKYEISKRVTDLLRSLFIQDYQSEPYHQHLIILMTLQLLQKILKHSAISSRKSIISSSKVLDPLNTILAAHTRKTLMEP